MAGESGTYRACYLSGMWWRWDMLRLVKLRAISQDFDDVSKNADIRSIAKSGILLTSFYGLTHPSQPNYIASVGGDYFGLDNDDVVRLPTNVSTVIDLFETKE